MTEAVYTVLAAYSVCTSVVTFTVCQSSNVTLCLYGATLCTRLQIHRGRLELFLHEVARREPLYFRQRGIEEQDQLYQDAEQYKEHYYQSKLGISADDEPAKRDLVKHYLEGLYWVLQYYHK
jgi:Xrn1 helical domain